MSVVQSKNNERYSERPCEQSAGAAPAARGFHS